MLKGLSPGAALVLLMAGPATNAATITMIGKVLGKKSLIGYLGAIITGALLSGLFIDYFLPHDWFRVSEHLNNMGHDHTDMLPQWLKIVSAAALTLLIINGYIQKFLSMRKIKSPKPIQQRFSPENMQTLQVGGMTCNHCKANVENNIKSAEGVEDATVDLLSGTVIIKGSSFDLGKIKSGIESIGYTIIKP